MMECFLVCIVLLTLFAISGTIFLYLSIYIFIYLPAKQFVFIFFLKKSRIFVEINLNKMKANRFFYQREIFLLLFSPFLFAFGLRYELLLLEIKLELNLK